MLTVFVTCHILQISHQTFVFCVFSPELTEVEALELLEAESPEKDEQHTAEAEDKDVMYVFFCNFDFDNTAIVVLCCVMFCTHNSHCFAVCMSLFLLYIIVVVLLH